MAFLSIGLIDRLTQLSADASQLESEFQKLSKESSRQLYEIQQELAVEKRKEPLNGSLESLQDFANENQRIKKRLKESENLNHSLLDIYKDTPFFSYKTVTNIKEVDNSWSLIDPQVSELTIHQLMIKSQDFLNGELQRGHEIIDIQPLLKSINSISIIHEGQIILDLDKRVEPLNQFIACDQKLESIVSLLFIVSIFPDYALALNKEERFECLMSLDDYLKVWTSHQALSQGRGQKLNHPWGIRIRKGIDQIELSCLFVHEKFTSMGIYQSSLQFDGERVIDYNNELVATHITKFVS